MNLELIEKMNTKEKLHTMEQLWESLCADRDCLIAPEWHEDVLKERQTIIDSGKANFYSLDELRNKLL